MSAEILWASIVPRSRGSHKRGGLSCLDRSALVWVTRARRLIVSRLFRARMGHTSAEVDRV